MIFSFFDGYQISPFTARKIKEKLNREGYSFARKIPKLFAPNILGGISGKYTTDLIHKPASVINLFASFLSKNLK